MPTIATTLARAALLVAGMLVVGIGLTQFAGSDADALLARLGTDRGPTGIALFVMLAGLVCAIGLPRQIAPYAGGYAFGLGEGIIWSLLAQMLGCVANFAWARGIARARVRAWLLARPGTRLDRLDRFLATQGFLATVVVRLLPVGHNTTANLIAGVSGIQATSFLLGSAIGFLPQTVVFALLGTGTQLENWTQLALGGALFAASAALGAVLLRRMRVDR